MKTEDAIKLKINQKVIIKNDDENELNYLAIVVCVDDRRKVIGVINFSSEYFEFPYRKILKTAK